MGTFFDSGKNQAARGEGWAPLFISCAKDIVGLSPPLSLRLLSYEELLAIPFYLYMLCFTFIDTFSAEICIISKYYSRKRLYSCNILPKSQDIRIMQLKLCKITTQKRNY